ncbi:prefoldin subunit [Cooperia oncophora]
MQTEIEPTELLVKKKTEKAVLLLLIATTEGARVRNSVTFLCCSREKEEPFETTYLVAEEVYTKATVPKPEKVSIWLGASIMVEYELDKAKELLVKNQGSVQKVCSQKQLYLDGFEVMEFVRKCENIIHTIHISFECAGCMHIILCNG